MTTSDAPLWNEAITSEMDFILEHETQVLTDLLSRCKPIGCKWIYKKKLNPDGTIDKYNVRLIAKGFSQNEGLNYFDTYLSNTCITTNRVLLALATSYKLKIHQINVKIVFLNGELEEVLYVTTRRICGKWTRRKSVQIYYIFVRSYTDTKTMVLKV